MFQLAGIVRRHAAERPDQPALICDERTLTFADLHAESSQVAHALLAANVDTSDRIGFIGKNGPEYFTVTYGAAKLNAVNVAVNWRLAPPEMDYILDNAEAKVVFVDAEFLGHLDSMDLPRNPLIVIVGDGGEHPDYSSWIEGHSTADPDRAVGENDTALQLYTSGTTGLPKGAEIGNRNLGALVEPFVELVDMSPDDIVLQLLPLFHIGGAAPSHISLSVGCTNIIHRDVNPARIFADIPVHRVTVSAMVPAILQVLPSIPGASDVDYSSLKTIVYGGSPISEEVLMASMGLFGCSFGQMYGLTEAGIVSWLAPDDHDPGGPRAKLLRSAGKPIGGMELRIVGTDGQDLPEGETGEIWARSRQSMKGYWHNADATAEAFPEGRDDDGLGWLATGDAGYLEDGFLFIQDRAKDMIVSGGENIYPAEVENVLMAHPAVADVAVIGIPNEQWGESPLALVVPAEGEDPTLDDIVEFCAERLARFKHPKALKRIEVIPRNAAGKIRKVELRKPYWEGHERAVN